ncbi:hypothetical protein QUC31_011068 [Theobroma cacao]|uniref:Zinc finger protein ZAT5 n=2 Tax=Theobroma cacao TaxID=3641 RepID=A0AB32V2N4_THECC|nr:PREDICTED: zinc finger protein ZAT5 [Theobroma cacao]EOY07971.1 Nucleic acid binding protein, putative [Theobroma cacao]WRX24564.1 C2H2-type zinc finger - like 10 [Theobroma cacao]
MMMMEGQEEVVLCKDQLQIIKGKRTKRPRPLSPLTLLMASSTTSSGGESGGEGGRNSDDSRGLERAVASPTTSVDELTEISTEEEEDMANCLILLAQGQTRIKPSEPASLATTSKTGIYVHQCKTCNRCFSSFQALGGHRASHKKPKVNNEENKGLVFVREDDDQFNNMNTALSLQITNKAVLCNSSKSKVHECSICGAEFSSGQALGGHMRRHRTFTNVPTTTATTALSVGTRSPESQESKKPRTVLQLDLNLPAPEDDHHRETKFSFASKEKLLVFSASSLVDCHY